MLSDAACARDAQKIFEPLFSIAAPVDGPISKTCRARKQQLAATGRDGLGGDRRAESLEDGTVGSRAAKAKTLPLGFFLGPGAGSAFPLARARHRGGQSPFNQLSEKRPLFTRARRARETRRTRLTSSDLAIIDRQPA